VKKVAGKTINQKGLVWPERRRLLKNAPLVFASVAAMAALPKAARAFVGGGTEHVVAAPAQPSAAATWGYNHCVVFDDFNDLSTIDVNNTLAPGYNWYMTQPSAPWFSPDGNPATGTTLAPSCVSIGNSILTVNPNVTHGSYLTSAGYTGETGARYTGWQVPATGFYTEVSMAFDPSRTTAQFGPPIFGWFAYFMSSCVGDLFGNDQNPTLTPHPELDIFEHFGTLTPPTNTILDWRGAHPGQSTIFSNTNHQPNFGSINWTQQNKVGCLWVPAAKNGGTGIVNFYINRNLLSSGFTYSQSGTSPQASGGGAGVFYDMDTCAGYCIKFGSGFNWPIFVDYIMLWQ
jgi:hypothetical protein